MPKSLVCCIVVDLCLQRYFQNNYLRCSLFNLFARDKKLYCKRNQYVEYNKVQNKHEKNPQRNRSLRKSRFNFYHQEQNFLLVSSVVTYDQTWNFNQKWVSLIFFDLQITQSFWRVWQSMDFAKFSLKTVLS